MVVGAVGRGGEAVSGYQPDGLQDCQPCSKTSVLASTESSVTGAKPTGILDSLGVQDLAAVWVI